RPFVIRPMGQGGRSSMLHKAERLTGAKLRHRDASNSRGGIQVVACDELRPEYSADIEDSAEWNHLPRLVGDIKVADIFQLSTIIGLGLHPDLEALVEFVEQVNVGRSQIGL